MALTLSIALQAALQGVSGVPQALVVPDGVWAVTMAQISLLFVLPSVAEGPCHPHMSWAPPVPAKMNPSGQSETSGLQTHLAAWLWAVHRSVVPDGGTQNECQAPCCSQTYCGIFRCRRKSFKCNVLLVVMHLRP